MKICLAWSGGKDSSFSLYQLLKDGFKVEKLFCTLGAETKRISMHGTDETLLEAQAKSLGIELMKVYLPADCTMEQYSQIMTEATKRLVAEGFTHLAFGDIFLEDLKEYRIKNLEGSGIQALFPLWGLNTSNLVKDFYTLGFKAKVVCCDAAKLEKSTCGSELNKEFIEALPDGVDPCGENGEFHSFVYDGPIFSSPLNLKAGEIELHHYGAETEFKSSFFFADFKLKSR